MSSSTNRNTMVYKTLSALLLIASVGSLFAQTTVTLYPDKDAHLHGHSTTVNNNYGTYPYIYPLKWTSRGVPYPARSLMQQDYSSIGSDRYIIEAKLTLYGLAHNPLSQSNASYLQRVTQSWDEGTVTWNSQPSVTTVDQLSLAQSTSSTQNYEIDITAHAQDMHENPSSNYGFLLRLQNEVHYTRLRFASSDYSNSAQHPKLVVKHVKRTGITLNSVTHKTIGCSSDAITETGGAIDITPTGGIGGYTYSWSGPIGFAGATTQDLSGLTIPGQYTVTVTPGSGNVETLTVSVGYNTDWTNFVGTSEVISGGKPALKNTIGSNNWCWGAASNNILSSGTDGWLEYKVTATNQHKIFGFSEYFETGHCWTYLDYGVYLKNNADLRRVISGAETSVGTYAVGDVIRVAREGTNLKIYQNGNLLDTYSIGTTGQNKILTAEASIWTSNGMLENVGSSFKPPMYVDIDVTNIECGETDNGSIALDPCGTGYVYFWDHGPMTSTVTDLTAGTYGVTIIDGNGWMVKKNISVGYDIDWTNEDNVSITNNIMNKGSGGSAWNAGANSSRSLSSNTDGWIEYEVVATNTERAIGFTENPQSTHPVSSIDYGVHLQSTGEFKSTVSGSNFMFGTVKEGDIIRISREGSKVFYYVNNFKKFSTNVNAAEALYVEAAIYTLAGKFEEIRCSLFCPITIEEIPYYRLTGNDLDGSYALTDNGVLRFVYDEEYSSGYNIKYKVYTSLTGVAYTNLDQPIVASKLGENQMQLDFSLNSNQCLSGGMYLLEVENQKGEKSFIRFKQPSSMVCSGGQGPK